MTQPASDGIPGQTDTDGPGQDGPPGESSVRDRVVVVTPEGMAVSGTSDEDASPTELIEQPAKVMRIGSMIKQLLEEVRSAPLDEAGRTRLAQIHERSIAELEQGLAPELVDELRRIALPFAEDETPSDAELRIAQAQLVGWLEGVFHGIQTALFAQQMAARAQLEEMRRRALPGGAPAVPQQPDFRPGGGQGGGVVRAGDLGDVRGHALLLGAGADLPQHCCRGPGVPVHQHGRPRPRRRHLLRHRASSASRAAWARTRPDATALRGPSVPSTLPVPQTIPCGARASAIMSGISKSSAEPPSRTTNSSARRLPPGATWRSARRALTTKTRRFASRRTRRTWSRPCRVGTGAGPSGVSTTTRAKTCGGSGSSPNSTVPSSWRRGKKLSPFPSGYHLTPSATSRSLSASSESISLVTSSPAPATWTAVHSPSRVSRAASVEPPPRSRTAIGRSTPGVVSAPPTAISPSTPPISAAAPSPSDTRSATSCIRLRLVRTIPASATAFSRATSPASPPRTSAGTNV